MDTRDLGFLPESELWRRAGDGPPRSIADYPLTELLDVADSSANELAEWLTNDDPAVRAAASRGLLRVSQAEARDSLPVLRKQLEDPSPAVRIAAAEALAKHGSWKDARQACSVLLGLANVEDSGLHVAVAALNALDAQAELSSDDVARIAALPRKSKAVPGRLGNYVPRLVEHLLARHPAARKQHTYKTVGDIELPFFVHQPAGAPPKGGRGAVVFFHGGGWNSGDPSQFYEQCEHLARRGIVAISAAYRLGNKHDATPDQCVADGKSAMRWVRAHAAELGIDPGRVAAGGGSAGGHIAAAVATIAGCDDEPESTISCRPDALVLFNAVFDNGPGGWGHARVEEYWESFSPLHNLSEETPPALVMLGTKDSLVPVETAERWKARMDELGVHCVLELYEDQVHGFFNRERNEAMYSATVTAMDAFLASLGWS